MEIPSQRAAATLLSAALLVLLASATRVESAQWGSRRRSGLRGSAQGQVAPDAAEARAIRRRLLGGDASAAPTPARQGNSGGTADSGAGGAPSPPAQQRVPVEPRIINGQVAVAADFAFMVALLLQGQQFCGGTLLDETTVLTAAHCIVDIGLVARPDLITAVTADGSRTPVAIALPHPGYSADTIPADNEDGTFTGPLHDVAILKLSRAVPNATTVTLADPSTVLDPGQDVQAAGWGITEDGRPTDVLHYANLMYLPPGSCPRGYSDVLCAGGGKTNTCSGDSGGPLLLRDSVSGAAVQVGVTSHGPDCPSTGPEFGYYTDVRLYREEIEALANGTGLGQLDGAAGAEPASDLAAGPPASTGSGDGGGGGSDTCLGSLSRYGEGVALVGGDLAGGFAAAGSPEDCCRLCYSVDECWAWTWMGGSPLCGGASCCFLKQLGGYKAEAAPGSVSGEWQPQSAG